MQIKRNLGRDGRYLLTWPQVIKNCIDSGSIVINEEGHIDAPRWIPAEELTAYFFHKSTLEMAIGAAVHAAEHMEEVVT